LDLSLKFEAYTDGRNYAPESLSLLGIFIDERLMGDNGDRQFANHQDARALQLQEEGIRVIL
jgi:hypothetical protein